MNIDVIDSVKEVNCERISGRNVVVIDVLRATSTIVTAMANKACCVIPVEHIEEAWETYNKEAKDVAILGGERDAKIIKGFHFGNSPLLYTEENVKGKKVVLTTTNGTRTIKACAEAEKLYIASFLNARAVANQLIKDKEDVAIVCSGTYEKYSMDDALCAGMITSLIASQADINTTDLGWTVKELYEAYEKDIHEILKKCSHYKRLEANGFTEDLRYCLQRDIYDIVPIYKDGYIRVAKESNHDS
ncbi:2-phosphosulfolactate phosphatase [Wukongibacter baidiensis]